MWSWLPYGYLRKEKSGANFLVAVWYLLLLISAAALFMPGHAKAFAGGSYTVHAVVPQSPAYDFEESKNSLVTHNAYEAKNASEVALSVSLRGPYDRPIGGHKVCVMVVSDNTRASRELCGLTDVEGRAHLLLFTQVMPMEGEYAVVVADRSQNIPVFLHEIARFSLGKDRNPPAVPQLPAERFRMPELNRVQEPQLEQTHIWWEETYFGTLNTVGYIFHAHNTSTPQNAAMDPPARTRDGPFCDASCSYAGGCRYQPPD